MPREITGKHVLLGFVAAFGLIIAVNVFMAYSAVSTFPGLEVKNSYIASQEFNKRKAAQEALGWTVDADYDAGTLRLMIDSRSGRPVQPVKLEAVVGRPTQREADVTLDLRHNGREYEAPVTLENGNWNIYLEAKAADGTEFRKRVVLRVK